MFSYLTDLLSEQKLIGLDIGSSTIKMAEMNFQRDTVQLMTFGLLPTPQGAVGAGDISNIQGISESIRTLALQLRSSRKAVSLGLWGTSVIVKKITMPRIAKKLIEQQIEWEAGQYIPFDPTAISLSYHVINSISSNDTMDILLVAAQKAMIQQFNQAVNLAQLRIGVLDVSGFALANTFELNYGRLSNETVALLNFGGGVTNCVILHDGEVIFSRDIPFGGSNYTLEIHREMGVTVPEAEALKLSAVSGGEVPEQVHSLISSVSNMMIDEIRNNFDFFSAGNANFVIDRCFFTGGSSGIPGLIDQLIHICGIPFEILNPFLKVRVSSSIDRNYLQHIAPFASVAIGLGIRKTKG